MERSFKMHSLVFLLSTTLFVCCKPESNRKVNASKMVSPSSTSTSSNSQTSTTPPTGETSSGVIDIHSQYSFSTGIKKLVSKQGIGEGRLQMSAADADARYKKLKSLGTSYRQYNLWWSALEGSGLTSSTSPLKCPAKYIQVPATEAEKIAMGYKKYRCVSTEQLQNYDELLKSDQANGIQSGVALWSSPPVYRYPACEGFGFGGVFLKDGCVPRDDAMDDFEDYVNLVASRYNGDVHGKITHFIIWNENASPDWFDYTPIATKTTDATSINKRIDKYADMLKRTHAALTRHQKSALMYVSTDQLIEKDMHVGHMGNKNLIDGLWTRLGTNYSWSLAVHPYGDVDSPAAPNTYTFENLELVVQYQLQKLSDLGIKDPARHPQSLLIASEQGWPLSTGRDHQAKQICLAHDKVMSMPQLLAVAHNYFHSVEPAEADANGQSVQGAFFGLIPNAIPNSLEGMENVPTGKAFTSTLNSALWKKDNNHYCCTQYGVGCKDNPVSSLTKFPIYRFYKNGDHLLTAIQSEGVAVGYAAEGIAFDMYTASSNANLVAIYRCSQPKNHFFSRASNCEGANVDGLIGYLLKTKVDSAKPVYRFRKQTGQHLITTDQAEGIRNGFIQESILGYAP